MKQSSYFIMALIMLIFLPSVAGAGSPIQKGERLDLQRCIKTAIENHPALQAARNNVLVGESRIGQARANYYPHINWQTDYTRLRPATSRVVERQTQNEYSSTVTLDQMLYDFGKTKTQVNIQKLNTDSFRQDLDNVESEIVLGVKQAYYTLLQAEKNREVALETVGQFQHHLEQAKGFFEVGTKPKFDVTKAEVDLSNAVLNRIRAENALRIARINLNNAMGIPAAPEYTIDDSLFFQKYQEDLQTALESAYRNRPDLLSILKRVEAADQSINLAKKGYYPYLTGSAGYGFGGGEFPLGEGWNFGAALNVPIFNGLLTHYQIEEAKANLNVAKANEQALRQLIRLEVEQAFSNLREAEERTATAQLAVRQAEENVELANGRYAAGVGNPIEVTDALVSLSNARTTHIAALTDYRIAQAGLEKAMGVK
ncbi:MAG: Outer membrane protein OprM precursor [Syntrophus sp. PtaB.Bin001]|nr:MAG: Outer membrane protein OprM precursor [Syntrophus sp. PtaB.Bin001]